MTGLTIKYDAPKDKLVTMGQADKEVEMVKEPTYESNPELYHYRPGTTEPELKPIEEDTEDDGPVGDDDENGDEDEPKAAGKKTSAKAPGKKK